MQPAIARCNLLRNTIYEMMHRTGSQHATRSSATLCYSENRNQTNFEAGGFNQDLYHVKAMWDGFLNR